MKKRKKIETLILNEIDFNKIDDENEKLLLFIIIQILMKD